MLEATGQCQNLQAKPHHLLCRSSPFPIGHPSLNPSMATSSFLSTEAPLHPWAPIVFKNPSLTGSITRSWDFLLVCSLPPSRLSTRDLEQSMVLVSVSAVCGSQSRGHLVRPSLTTSASKDLMNEEMVSCGKEGGNPLTVVTQCRLTLLDQSMAAHCFSGCYSTQKESCERCWMCAGCFPSPAAVFRRAM